MKETIFIISTVLFILGLFLSFCLRGFFKSREERYRINLEKWGKIQYIGLGMTVVGFAAMIIIMTVWPNIF
jgi:hypothetical protein